MASQHLLSIASETESGNSKEVRSLSNLRDLTPDRVRDHLAELSVPLIRLAGPPGAGKSTLIEATLRRVKGRRRIAVIVCNPAADRDADLLRPLAAHSMAIPSAVPELAEVARAIESIEPANVDLIILESCGGIAPFPDVGENAIVSVLGVSCGDDKAAEYGGLVSQSAAVLLTQIDLLPYIRFCGNTFHNDVQRLNAAASVMEISTINSHGMDAWVEWLEEHIHAARRARCHNEICGSELFVG